MALNVSLPDLGKNTLNFSVGELAMQANGSVVTSFAETIVLTTACILKTPREARDFLPLTVEYQEKTYAMGKIPGGFFKKEGRPKDKEILSARLIDRPLRPLFPKGLTNDLQIIAMVLSSDGKNDPDVLAVNGASCALLISDIPFHIPVGAVRVSQLEGSMIINPTYEEREKSDIDLVIVGTESKIVMLEGVFGEIKEEDVLKAIEFAKPYIKKIIDLQVKLKEKVGKKKEELPLSAPDKDLVNLIKEKVAPRLEGVYGLVKKQDREAALKEVFSSLAEELVTEDSKISEDELKKSFFAVEEDFVRSKILKEGKRPDGRPLDEIRPISCVVQALPRTHGSAIFTRGQTQALAVTTLGTSADEQFIEALEGEKTKHFMLHYLFPPFSVGEIKPLRGPSRRDIGHGTLAEKALAKVVPSKDEFPYTIRVVSEILESNGSSSMATVCATSLSLMDAGVPIKEPVAGIAIGLVSDGEKYKVLTDIAGVEDAYGDMDFKIAGTRKGITAIQLDVKNDGLTQEIIKDSLNRAMQVRETILSKMNKVLSFSRENVSQYAPKIRSFKIDPDKIGNIIGPGGKIIRRMSRDNNVTIDIEDDQGNVSVVAENSEDLERVVNQIISLTKDIEAGQIYDAKVTRLVNFGAFCEILPGKTGLVHVSEVADQFVKDVRQFLKEGDAVRVKVLNIDNQGRINLSIKQVSAAGDNQNKE